MKSYRERYFENYEAVKEPASNKKGYRVRYVYTGAYLRYDRTRDELKRTKLLYLLIEAISITILLLSALPKVSLLAERPVVALCNLAMLPWLIELVGVARFIFAKEYMTEADEGEIRRMIAGGAYIRAGLMALGMLVGTVLCVADGTMTMQAVAALCGQLCSAGISVAIARLHKGLYIRTYRNKDGEVAGEY